MDFPYKHISILAMPTEYCNMNCVYCFNGRKTCLEKKQMTDETLRHMMEITIPFYEEVKFIWHGGEPLSMGIDFYKKVRRIQDELNQEGGVRIKNSIQSNLTLLTPEYVEFFKENDFHVGGSFDGTQNEKTRHNSEAIIRGYELLRAAGGHSGFICVVQRHNIEHLIDDYEWFKKHDYGYTINPYLTSYPYEGDELFVPAKEYLEKMEVLFDYYLNDTKCNISINYFEIYLKMIIFRHPSMCCFTSCMGRFIGIDYDGSIYPCNRDFPKEYCYGNIHDYQDIHQCFESKGFEKLAGEAVMRRKKCKEECRLYNMCSGGCNNNALMAGDITKSGGYSCQIFIGMYDYIEEKIMNIINLTKEELKDKYNPKVVEMIVEYQNKQTDVNQYLS